MSHVSFSSPSDKLFQPVWKLLISLIETNTDSPFVQEQLQELTNLYDIPVDLSEKIIISIQNVAFGAFGAFDRRILVNVFVSANAETGSPLNRNWGFFRIERISAALEPEEAYTHLVEIYLYLEE